MTGVTSGKVKSEREEPGSQSSRLPVIGSAQDASAIKS